ncbi:unnamed protein product [Rotaria magnacalcarata]|uniref:Uncharacterized protein n=1 Tax=Rotaria magnacalcarata TaxID=392030 RepID=A0A816M0U7_9BILA|nr:unnamed protein product [Rotaria magnacalcarata]CAF2026412.1 unnamed protein product [Rotaria magnacalcarata]CAF4355358.1 unnamed protein product [Rotaria magnacalcarata]CAF4425240.1 unnamed protein product [Rotaria magnacalcarata]
MSLVGSNFAPNLFIDHSISTTTSQLELNLTGSGDDIENDATESAYQLLNEILNETSATETASIYEKSPIITPIASPNGHIHSSSLNFPFNSTSSSVASIDAVKRLIKRPYGVSVTDLDVLGENIMKQRKKQVKKATVVDNDEISKTSSIKLKL